MEMQAAILFFARVFHAQAAQEMRVGDEAHLACAGMWTWSGTLARDPDLLVIVLNESLLLVLRKVCLCEHFNALGIVRTFEDRFVQRSSLEKKA
jgi:hypothetical protein